MLLCGMNFINLIRIQFIFGIEDQLILSYNPRMTIEGESVMMRGTIRRHNEGNVNRHPERM